MKNLFKLFMPVAVAATVFASCAQENIAPVEPETLKITVKAHAQDLANDPIETKTYIDGSDILWGTGEYMKIGVFDGTATVFDNSSDESADKYSGNAVASFEFSITPANNSDSYTYYGLYPASAAVASSNNNPASYKVKLPSIQDATATSYDPKAYILVAQPDAGHNAANANWNAAFRRATALNKITLKNVPLGVSIKRVEITAPEGKYLAGSRYFNLGTETADDVLGDIYSGGGRTETVAVKFATPQNGGADIDVWFTSWGVELDENDPLVIVAYTTNKKSYTKNISARAEGIKFQEGCLNTLGVSMSGITPEDVTELEEGTYLVLANNNGTYYALKAEAEGTRMNYETYDGSTLAYAGSNSSIIWAISKSEGSYIFANGSNYLGWTSGNTSAMNEPGESWTTTNYLLDVIYDSTNSCYNVSVHSDGTRIFAKNADSKYGFAFYTGSGYKQILFVPATIDNRTAVSLTFDNDQVDLTPAEAAQYLGEDLTVSPDVAAVNEHLTWIYEDNDGIIDEFDNGALTLTGDEGTATVTVSFAGDENYLPASASYTISVSAPAVTPTTGWFETALDDLTSSDVFVIVGNNGENYAMNHTTLNSKGAPTATAVTVTGTTLSADPSDELKWNLIVETDGYVFYPDGVTNKWLNLTADNNGIRVNNTAANGKYWSLDSSGYLKGTDTADATRYIGIYSSTDWRSYTSNGGNIANQTFKFYKYVAAPDNRESAPISWGSATGTATWSSSGISSNLPSLTNTGSLEVSYSSSNEAVATVANDGTVTILSGGSTTISATYDGSDANAPYKTTTVSYTLNVTDNRTACATPTFSPVAGEVAANSTVTISCATEDATIHYTDDGSAPTAESAVYSSPILIDATKTIKAIAVKDNYLNSEVASAAYTIAVVTVGSGTEADPYTAGDILDKYPTGSGDTEMYVTGTITGITEVNTTYHNATYTISDGTRSILVFRGKYLNNTDFTSSDQIAENDIVVVYGKISVYNNAPQLAQNNYLYSINGKSKALTAGSLSTSKDDANKQITVTWGAATGTTSAISYVVNCGTQSYDANAAGSHTFTMADYGTYDISVVASADDAISATASTSVTLTDPNSNIPDPIVLTTSTEGFRTGSYGTANAFDDATLEGYAFKIQQVYVNGGKLQWRASGNANGTGTMYNADAMPAGITSIVIVFNSSDSNKNHTVQIGASANPTSATSISPSKSGNTYTFAGDGTSTYFVITNGTGAGYIDSITINFD